MTAQRKTRSPLSYVLLIIALLSLFSAFSDLDTEGQVSYSYMVQLFQTEQVDAFSIRDDTVTMKLKTPVEDRDTFTCQIYGTELFYQDLNDLIRAQSEAGTLTNYNYLPDSETPWWLESLPTLLIGLMVCFFFVTMMRNQAGGQGGPAQFGKAHPSTNAENNGKKVTFKDVAGADEEKAELQEIVDFLKDPNKFNRLGARIPKGILLVGPPGTGKTLLAKAVAGEADVLFLSISGSDFVELYVGVGASRVRDLFEQAKKNAPAIVFIDEIDAVGRQRGTGLGGGHDEREQTLNQLLVEMDGFAGNSGVIVMAATNRQDILDPALLRPGRFDRQIYVGHPDAKGREGVLKVHCRNKPLADDVDLSVVARATSGFTGADLENLMNEGALLAARKDKPVISMADLHEAMIKVLAGPEKKSRVVSPQARRLTAYHEAGHAIAMRCLPTHDPVHQITIVPRGQAGGMTIALPEEDRSFESKRALEERIIALLGGRVAEALVLQDISTGASNDLKRATQIAHAMVAKYGMSDRMGSVVYSTEDNEVFIGRSMGQSRSYSEESAAAIDLEVRAIMDSAYARCQDLLTQHREILEQTAQYLLEHETMSALEFERLFDPTAQKAPEGEALARLAGEQTN